MNTQGLVVFTGVGETPFATMALQTVHVGFHTAMVASLDVCDIVADLYHFNPQFMAGYAWITVKRHLSQIAAVITSANANPVNLQKGLIRTRLTGFRDIDHFEVLGLFQQDCLHGCLALSYVWLSRFRMENIIAVGRMRGEEKCLVQELLFNCLSFFHLVLRKYWS
jgi:hypothetical protein